MGEFKLLNVGVIKGSNLEEYYQIMMESDGHSYSLELNFQKQTIEESKRGVLKDFMYSLEKFDTANRAVIQSDFLQGGQVQSYVDFSCDRFGKENLAQQLHLDLNAADFMLQLVSGLQLIRIALYPDGEYNTSYYASFDYVLNKEFSNQIIAVKTDDQGHFLSISWER